MSLQVFDDGEWTHYCKVCGDAMASVVKDSQNRDPKRRKLPTPPEGKGENPKKKPKAAEPEKSPAKPSSPKASAKTPVKASPKSSEKAPSPPVKAPPPAKPRPEIGRAHV